MLMSTIEAPTSIAMPAARASASGSRPKIWTANRRPPRLAHMRPIALAAPRVSASADRNSVNVSAAPSSSHTVRNGRSVTASIGARRAPGLSSMSPMRMEGRENSTALVAVLMFALFALHGAACRKQPAPAPAPAQPASADEALLAGVVDPWTWPRAAGAGDRERAVEDIGPYERARPGDGASPLVNTNAHYWTALAGIAWDRDVDIDFDREPIDLDGDGRPDTQVTRHIHAKGGVLANPALFGLTPTPDDPRGRVGRVSASTGVLGLREALRPDGTPSGEIGMTCWLCHGGAADARAILGVAGSAFDYGLLLATAGVLDDANADAAAYRRARGFPRRAHGARAAAAGGPGPAGPDRRVRPGRDRARHTTPRATPAPRASARGRAASSIRSASPASWRRRGSALENWSGSEDAAGPWLERLVVLAGRPAPEALAAFGLPVDDRGAARRALLFDLRNLGTLGLQHDSFPGLLWADAIYGHAQLSAAATAAVPAMYAAAPARRTVAAETARWQAAAKVTMRGEGRGRRQRCARALDLRGADRRNDREPPDPEARPPPLRGGADRGTGRGADRRDPGAGCETGGALRRLSFRRAAGAHAAAGGEPAAARAVHALPCQPRGGRGVARREGRGPSP